MAIAAVYCNDTLFLLVQTSKSKSDGKLDKWCSEDKLPQEVVRKVGGTRGIPKTGWYRS